MQPGVENFIEISKQAIKVFKNGERTTIYENGLGGFLAFTGNIVFNFETGYS